MDARQLKAKAIVAGGKITRGPGYYLVPGSSGDRYRVILDGLFPNCTCPDFETTRLPCKHMLAATEWDRQLTTMTRSENRVDPETLPLQPRKTYRQDWSSYNKAACREKDHFQQLLADLCRGVPEPQRTNFRGRPIPLRDGIFAACFKVFSGYSARRFTCDLEAATVRGFIGRTPHFNSVLNVLDNPAVTPILTALVTKSALPLKDVETQFAVDSSGFSSTRLTRWFDKKHGQFREKADWKKAHILTGTKTNVVTAAVVTEQYDHDSPELPKLLKATAAAAFNVLEVSADMAYSGNPAYDAVDSVGGVLYCPFKKTATGAAGGLFEKAFHFFNLHREEFLRSYHRRSNVETTFMMVKAKFSEALRSKTDTAMTNEILAKLVCHNIACVVSAIYELGVNPDYLGFAEEPCTIDDEPAQLIPFPRRL